MNSAAAPTLRNHPLGKTASETKAPPLMSAEGAVGCSDWVRPVLPKPVQTGGWEAKVAGEFGEQRTPRSPRT